MIIVYIYAENATLFIHLPMTRNWIVYHLCWHELVNIQTITNIIIIILNISLLSPQTDFIYIYTH